MPTSAVHSVKNIGLPFEHTVGYVMLRLWVATYIVMEFMSFIRHLSSVKKIVSDAPLFLRLWEFFGEDHKEVGFVNYWDFTAETTRKLDLSMIGNFTAETTRKLDSSLGFYWDFTVETTRKLDLSLGILRQDQAWN